MKSCLSFILFMIFLSVLDVLVGKVLPFEVHQTLRLVMIGIFLAASAVLTWRGARRIGWARYCVDLVACSDPHMCLYNGMARRTALKCWTSG